MARRPARPVASPSLEVVADVALAVTLAVLGVVSVLVPDPSVAYEFPPAGPGQVLLSLAATLPLAARRTRPVTIFGVVLVATTVLSLPGWNSGLTPIALVIAVYTVADRTRRPTAIACLLAVYASMALLTWAQVPYFDSWWAVVSPIAFTAFWTVGVMVRSLREARAVAQQQALEAERTRAAAAANAVTEERLRIARELHDVVSHTLSVVSVQAGAARLQVRADPDAAVSAMRSVETAARAAMDDLRGMLGLMRAVDTDAPVELRPQPGTGAIRQLLEDHGAGPVVTLDLAGPVDGLPDSMRLTIFRIVQEALTNARRHAEGAPVSVSIRADEEGAEVAVVNGRSPSGAGSVPGGGWGLLGLRERVAVYRGRLEAGPDDQGGFAVRARLQLPDGAR